MPSSAIASLHDDAARWVFDRYCAQHPEAEARMGTAGARAFRQDVGYHVEHLTAALELEDPRVFASYMEWVAEVFTKRGLSLVGLGDSLGLLAGFFRERLGDGAAAAESTLGTARAYLDDLRRRPPATGAAPPAELSRLARDMVRGDHRSAWTAIATMLEHGSSYVDVAVEAITPAMVQVGEGWQAYQLSVAQEHLATSNATLLLTKAFAAAPMAPLNGRRALFAAIEGNRHALGLQMLADTFALAGWEAQNLGADVPTGALLSQIDEFRPELVALSVTLASHLPTLRDAVARIRASQLDPEPRIMVGGQVFKERPELWRAVGADLWSQDARTALALVA